MPAPVGGADVSFSDAYELLEVWERGRTQHPVDRALTLVGVVHRDVSRRELAGWCLGDRDAVLLSMYHRNFGDVLEAAASCPDCGAIVEAWVRLAELPLERDGFQNPRGTVSVGGRTIRFRLPNTRDLAAIIAHEDDPAAARDELLRRLVTEPADDISGEDAEAVESAIEEADPLTEISLVLACPECECTWVESLDVTEFLWAQLAARAERLLWQVKRLARAYGWTEPDVLALSPARRQWYVEATER